MSRFDGSVELSIGAEIVESVEASGNIANVLIQKAWTLSTVY